MCIRDSLSSFRWACAGWLSGSGVVVGSFEVFCLLVVWCSVDSKSSGSQKQVDLYIRSRKQVAFPTCGKDSVDWYHMENSKSNDMQVDGAQDVDPLVSADPWAPFSLNGARQADGSSQNWS
eukprot:10327258-Karenia_brevis.AAC.1